MKEFRLFIASTLSNEYIFSAREEISKTVENSIEYRINEFLKSLSDKCQGLKIYTYRFEKDDANIFSVAGAQAEINRHIDECHAFILLADSRIGKKTIEEFRYAKERIMRDRTPSFISVFKVDGPDEDCRPDQEPFDLFCDRELKFVRYDENGKIQEDNTVYPYIFKSFEDLCDKLEHDIKHWLFDSDRRPLFKAELGRDVEPSFFYTDPERLRNCHDAVYFRRDFDDRLYAAMLDEDKQVILLKGRSLSGKTRSLYQAVKNFPDAYFYRVSQRNDPRSVAEEINDLTGYIMMSRNRSHLFLIIDDVHQLALNPEVRMAIQELRNAIVGKNIHLIMTSTSDDGRSDDDVVKPDSVVKISRMTDAEYAEARLFCRRYEIEFRAGYQELGAMMIDLNQIAGEYKEFLKRDDAAHYAKLCLFQAVKAFSIWHSASLGDVARLFDFTTFLLKTYTGVANPMLVYEAFNGFMALRGVNQEQGGERFRVNRMMTLPKYIYIEEYVYRYILGFSGEIIDDHHKSSYQDELYLVNDILSYVDEYLSPSDADETIIINLSKIARRAEHRDKLAGAIYDIVADILKDIMKPSETVPSDPPIEDWKNAVWYRRLRSELEEVKNEVMKAPDADNESCSLNCIYLSKILWSKMLLLDTFDQQYDLFQSVPVPLQSDAMYGALITKCEDKDEPTKRHNLARLKGVLKSKGEAFLNSYYIINKVLPYYKDFQSAYDHFMKGIRPYASDNDYVTSAAGFAQMLKARNQTGEEWGALFQKDIRRQNFMLALNSLAQKVRNLDDFHVLMGIIRDNFVMLLDNLEVAELFVTKSSLYNRENLTVIDLLARLNLYGTRGAVGNLFKWTNEVPEDMIGFMDDELIPEFVATLTNHTNLLQNASAGGDAPVPEETVAYTLRHKAKHTANLVFNVFIERCCACRFADIKKEIFDRMEVPYNGRIVNLRDSYTYSCILRSEKCTYLDALDMYNNYIEPHSQDPESHLRVQRFILNEILNKVNSRGAYEAVSRLYDENKVTRDRYSYNISLRNLDYDTCVKKILPKMVQECDLDAFTLGELIAKSPNVKIAATYFKPLFDMGVKMDDNRVPSVAASHVRRMVEEYTTDTRAYPLEDQHYFWATLVSVPCADDDDRETLFRVLSEYLEADSRRQRIFGRRDKGVIYNNCLKNRTFIRSYEEAMAFIEEKKVKVDEYTFSHLQTTIRMDYAGTPEVSEYLLRLYKDHMELVRKKVRNHYTIFYNERLGAYTSYQEKLPMLFVYADGHHEIVDVTPLEYVRYLLENGLPYDKFTALWYAKISSGNTPEILQEFVDLADRYRLPLLPKTVGVISGAVKAMFSADQCVPVLRKLYELPIKDDYAISSHKVVKMYANGLYDLETAFGMVDGNLTYKLNNYTQLLTQYRKLEDPEKKPDGFTRALTLYESYIERQGISPNADILSNLANLAVNAEQLKCVFDKMSAADVKAVVYLITPIMKVSTTVDEVKYFIDRYHGLGGKPLDQTGSEKEVEVILRGLTIISSTYPSSDVHAVLGNLKACLLDDLGVARTYDVHFPCLTMYEKEGNVMSQNSLADLLGCWTRPDDGDDPKKLYLQQSARLLEKFYHRGNDIVNRMIISKMKWVIRQLSISHAEILQLFYPYPRLAFMYAADSGLRTYEEYKILIGSWNANFDRVPEDHAMKVVVDILSRIGDTGNEVLSNMMAKWDEGITLGDCLIKGDAESGEYMPLTTYKDNEVLRRRHMDAEYVDAVSGSRNPVRAFVNVYGDDFSDAGFFRRKLDEFCATRKPDFAALKSLLPYLSGNPDGTVAVLEKMAERWGTYSDLKYISNALCSEGVKASEILADKLVSTIAGKRHEDLKINLVYRRILDAVAKDSLCIADFACSPLPAPRNVTSAPMSLSAYWVRICRLLHEMSALSGTMPQSELLVCVENMIADFYRDDKKKSFAKIDAAILQEFLVHYIGAYNACEKQKGNTDAPRMFEVIRTIMSTSWTEMELDISMLFSDTFKAAVAKPDYWYKVRSSYVSRIMLSKLKCSEKDKFDMLIASRTHWAWMSTVYKGRFQQLAELGEILYSSASGKVDIAFYLSCLFDEAGNVSELMHAVNELARHDAQKVYVDGRVIINAIIRIVGHDVALINALLAYNDRRMDELGPSGDISRNPWSPDSVFFNEVMRAEALLPEVDAAMSRCFKESYLSHPFVNFVSDLILMRQLKGCSASDANRLMDEYVSSRWVRFNNSGRIENGFVIAAFLKATWTASYVIEQIMSKSAYNDSVLPKCGKRADVFSHKMDSQIFRELSKVVEIKREKGLSRTTTQTLLHKLLMSCGPDFVLEDPGLLVGVAKTIRTVDEYKMFISDLRQFYIPVGNDLTAEIIRTLSSLIRNQKDSLLKQVVSRVKALAEYDSYFQGTDCHDFKAGYLIYDVEQNIDFKHVWASQALHVDKEHEVMEYVKGASWAVRVSSIGKIGSPLLRYEVLLTFLVKNENMAKFRSEHDEALGLMLDAMAKADDPRLSVRMIIKIFERWAKCHIMLRALEEKTLLSVISFYRYQLDNPALGAFYRDTIIKTLRTLKRLADRSLAENKPWTYVYYTLFIRNDRGISNISMKCATRKLADALRAIEL